MRRPACQVLTAVAWWCRADGMAAPWTQAPWVCSKQQARPSNKAPTPQGTSTPPCCTKQAIPLHRCRRHRQVPPVHAAHLLQSSPHLFAFQQFTAWRTVLCRHTSQGRITDTVHCNTLPSCMPVCTTAHAPMVCEQSKQCTSVHGGRTPLLSIQCLRSHGWLYAGCRESGWAARTQSSRPRSCWA
jgi:hypothetical protein